jgi:hypothetical protein
MFFLRAQSAKISRTCPSRLLCAPAIMVMPPSIAVARHCALPSGLGIFIWLEQLLTTNQSYSVQCWTAFISGRLRSVSCKGLVHAVACKVLRGREKKKIGGDNDRTVSGDLYCSH